MNTAGLGKIQDVINVLIARNAIACNLTQKGVREPIYDGVLDAEEYLNSAIKTNEGIKEIKVLWVLEEPYDAENGEGGDFPVKDVLKGNPLKIVTWARIAYIMHGFFNGMNYNAMNGNLTIAQAIDALKKIAVVNVSKMPALPFTNMSNLKEKHYDYWKEIVWLQLLAYQPDVIVMAGSCPCLEYELPSGQYKKNISLGNQPWYEIYEGNDVYDKEQILIETYHPSCRKKVADYVDNIIEALQKAFNKVSKKQISGRIFIDLH